MPQGPYDTPLSLKDEQLFRQWKAKNSPNDSGEDYDLRGAYKADLANNLPRDDRGHTTDLYKKPNHPTFSTQSQYNGKNGQVGGEWKEANGKTLFLASPTNIAQTSRDGLASYFKQEEPEAGLVMPPGPSIPKGLQSAPPGLGFKDVLNHIMSFTQTVAPNNIQNNIKSVLDSLKSGNK